MRCLIARAPHDLGAEMIAKRGAEGEKREAETTTYCSPTYSYTLQITSTIYYYYYLLFPATMILLTMEVSEPTFKDEEQSLSTATTTSKASKKDRRRRNKQQHSLDYLRQRVTALMEIFEKLGLWIPPQESMSEKGKVWSSRNYGADKKRQRKNAERQLLEDRIQQLEKCLEEKAILEHKDS